MMYPCLEGFSDYLVQAIGNSSSPVSIMKVLETTAVALACLSGQVLGRAVSHRGGALNVFEHSGVEQRALLQDIVGFLNSWGRLFWVVFGFRLGCTDWIR